jgi:hypothetical protein
MGALLLLEDRVFSKSLGTNFCLLRYVADDDAACSIRLRNTACFRVLLGDPLEFETRSFGRHGGTVSYVTSSFFATEGSV